MDAGRDRDRPPELDPGRPGHHDPIAGIGGAAPARSALTLRLVLAGFGFLLCTGLAIWFAAAGAPVLLVTVLAGLTVVAFIDLLVVARRKQRGEPG